MNIKPEIIEILKQSSIEKISDSFILRLPDTKLDRTTYLEVNKVLEALGGKWNKKSKGHVFSEDPSQSFSTVIDEKKVIVPKDDYEFFPTPKNIITKMIELSGICHNDKNLIVLEPSVGEGAILSQLIDFMDESTKFVTIDKNPKVEKIINSSFPKAFHVTADFCMTWPSIKYDRILMNPPFSNSQDIDHITHAFDLLKEGGVLVSVCSESPFFNSHKKSKAFLKLIEEHGESIKLPEGSFKSSGTMVKTRLVVLRK